MVVNDSCEPPVAVEIHPSPETTLEGAVLAQLEAVFARLRRAQVPYCILRNRDRIPAALLTGSDVDLILPPRVGARRIIALMADLRPVHIVAHRATVEMYFRVGPIFLHVDFLIADRQWRGARYLKNAAILDAAGDEGGMVVASRPHQAFCAWFSSLTRWRVFKPRYAPLIEDVVRESPAAMRGLLHDAFGARLGDELLELAERGQVARCEALAGRCRRAVWRRAFLRRPLATVAGAVNHYFHEARQYLRPSGACVAVIGPDGAGKSAACHALANTPRGGLPWKQVEARHLYQRVLPLLSELRRGRVRRSPAAPATVHDPHGKRPHSAAVSLFTLAWYTVDQWLSRWRWSLRKLSQNTLLLHDRHLLEIVIDPKRFRYGGPRWLPRWALRLLPRPDLVILLDAPAEVLQSRKQEVPFEETARQREAYRSLVASLPQGRIVDASQPAEAVAADVKETLIQFLAERTARRFLPELRR